MDDGVHTPAPPAWLTSPAAPAGRAKAGLLLKGIVSVLLLAFLVSKVDWLAMEVRLIAAKPAPLFAALALLMAEVFLAALRWRLLVTRTGIPMPVLQAVELTFAGLFFGQVLPATIGGDVVRGVLAVRNGFAWRDVVSGIVLDRVTALAGSMLLILVGLPWLLDVASGASSLLLSAFASGVMIVGLAVGLCVDLLPLPQGLVRRRFIGGGLALVKQVRHGLFRGQDWLP